ncbi:hypothetical protein Tco_0496443 [Tanacetum coccineum]
MLSINSYVRHRAFFQYTTDRTSLAPLLLSSNHPLAYQESKADTPFQSNKTHRTSHTFKSSRNYTKLCKRLKDGNLRPRRNERNLNFGGVKRLLHVWEMKKTSSFDIRYNLISYRFDFPAGSSASGYEAAELLSESDTYPQRSSLSSRDLIRSDSSRYFLLSLSPKSTFV